MIRYEFIDKSIHSADLHPDSIYHKEQALAKTFVLDLPPMLEWSPSPISGAKRFEALFEKWGQVYALCPDTWSLELAFTPGEGSLREYFHDSDLSRFRATEEYQEVVTRTRGHLWENQLDWLEGRVRRYLGMNRYSLLEWGPKSAGWINIVKDAGFVSELNVYDSLPPVVDTNKPDNIDIVSLFDVIQRTANPGELLKEVAKSLRPGGLLILTCRSGSGFDVLTLQGESDSIFPLDHVCLPSPQGMTLLMEQAGFELLELTTPGQLDVELIKRAGGNIPPSEYFARYMVDKCEESVLDRLQAFLQQNNLSSHMRLVAKKGATE